MTQKLSEEAHSNKVKYNNNYNKKMIECQYGKFKHVKTNKHKKYMEEQNKIKL
jgi:hypothetical protein